MPISDQIHLNYISSLEGVKESISGGVFAGQLNNHYSVFHDFEGRATLHGYNGDADESLVRVATTLNDIVSTRMRTYKANEVDLQEAYDLLIAAKIVNLKVV